MTASRAEPPAPGVRPGRSGPGWDDALDQFEAQLVRQEAALAGKRQLPATVIPEIEGPIPEHLMDRARALLERSLRLEERTLEAMGELRRRQPTFATGAPRGNDLGQL